MRRILPLAGSGLARKEGLNMQYGWIGTILLIDLSAESIKTIDTMKYAEDYIGGRGLAARLAWEYIPKEVDCFSPESPLIVMTGPLTGTPAPTSGRVIFAGVSPRVYPKPWYTHSTMGGFIGSELKYAGFDGLIITGKSRNPAYLWIRNGEANIMPAEDLWGLTIRATVEKLRHKYGHGIEVACIGPAGERLVRYAAISHPPENASGHSGFGAVMGSKKIKAIAVQGAGGVSVAEPEHFLATCKYAVKLSRPGAVDYFLREEKHRNPACSHSCSVNCRIGTLILDIPQRFGEGKIGSYQVFCIGNIWVSSKPAAEYKGGGLRVPPVTGWKPEDGGVELHMLCDDLGLDLWVLLTLQPWLVRCVEIGLNSLKGLDLDPRDPAWFRRLLESIAYRRGLGDILAEGLRRAVDRLREELPDELVKLAEALEFAYGFPAHREGRIWDPEPLPFWIVSALMYATESRDPTICTHTSFLHLAELYLDNKDIFLFKLKPIAAKLWGSEKAIEPSFEHKVQLAIWCQHRHIILDCLPLCDFAFPRLIKPFKSREEWLAAEDVYGDLDIEAKLLSACTGIRYSTEDLEIAAERTFNLERMILAEKFGRNREIDEIVAAHFQLPCSTDGTSISMQGFKELLTEYYQARGYDKETGKPLPETLRRLKLNI
ncbi:MAG: aldehyde ferredoxin oxidoreductase N-terminal domain-containing protein [Thermoproteota archaeon]